MDGKYPRRKFTIRLEYTVHIPEDETYTTTLEASDETEAIEKAWTEMYERNGYDEVDEHSADVTDKQVIPGRGCEDDKTSEMFPK